MAEINPSLNATANKQNKLKALALWEVGIFELSFVILGFLIIFGIINYFNVLPVTQTFPFFSFLPRQQKIAENKTQANPAYVNQLELSKKAKALIPFLGCPLKQELCANGIIIPGEKDKLASFSGIGYSKLPQGTEILSSANGDIELRSQVSDGGTFVTIVNKGRNIQVNYEFPKDSFRISSPSAKTSEEGKIIGVVFGTNRTIDKFGGKFNLIFSTQSLTTKEYVNIKPAADGKSLLNVGP